MPTLKHNILVRAFLTELKTLPNSFDGYYIELMHTSRIRCANHPDWELTSPFDSVLKTYPECELRDFPDYFESALNEAIEQYKIPVQKVAGLFD